MWKLETFDRMDYNKEISVTRLNTWSDDCEDLGANYWYDGDATWYYNHMGITHGWTDLNIDYNSYVKEGDLYMERYSNGGTGYDGDDADLVYYTGHGWITYVPLYHCEDEDTNSPNDDSYITFNGLQDDYSWEGEVSSDGFDRDTEWVIIMSCNVLSGIYDEEDEYNIIQTMLYHNLHMVLGYQDELQSCTASDWWCSQNPTTSEKYNVIQNFEAYTNDGYKIYCSWHWANDDEGVTEHTIYYKDAACDDYLWDVGTVSADTYSKDITIQFWD
jgi:hypothetical protein